jgi:hypothetical protein
MGTNYYLQTHEGKQGRHIGKSSKGWTFALRQYPEDMIFSLHDWTYLIDAFGVLDENGSPISRSEFYRVIKERDGRHSQPAWAKRDWSPHDDEQSFHAANHSMRGPRRLLRRVIGKGGCVGHGHGTWDYVHGDFS